MGTILKKIYSAPLLYRLRQDGRARFGGWVMLVLLLLALSADFIASDHPILISHESRVYFFPNIITYGELIQFDYESENEGVHWYLPTLVKFGPEHHDLHHTSTPPDVRHWMGTDDRGRDIFARVIHGTRVSLLVGFLAVAIYMAIGIPLGLVAGYFGGWSDAIIRRVVEMVMAFPPLLLVFVLVGLARTPSLTLTLLVIGFTRWAFVSQLVRGEVLKQRELDYIVAARALGTGHLRILCSHILPNISGPLLVTATFGISSAIITEGFLSFLGFGGDVISWGRIFAQSELGTMGDYWVVLFPGLALFLTVLACNYLGEALQEAVES